MFQFQKVRLQVWIPLALTAHLEGFNSKRYDYKCEALPVRRNTPLVSIPKGTITSHSCKDTIFVQKLFQFQKVRLQAPDLIVKGINEVCFNSKRYDYKIAQAQNSIMLIWFQFQKVRLQGQPAG